MPNRLATSTSPYLLQHQDNPVDWFPWGPDALERSRKEDKPIFLSIGYSACHWCHVMAHESFENEALARQLNDSFVSIKVDREERPDLDHIYMAAVQAISGRGGWPMSVFLTPDGQPFFGGTYWPPERRMGMPGFDEVLRAVADLWHNRRPAAIEQAEQLTEHVRQTGNPAANAAESTGAMGSLPALARPEFTVQQLATAVAALERMFDFTYGGFGGAPKFPHAMDLQLLMRFYLREGRSGVLDMVRKTLDHMAGGGIYEHLGGGFHRYSVDRQWLVPHFEKMLYDNALLARTYTDAWRLTGDPEYASVVRGTLDYLLNEMQDEAGGFYSTQDADSEGVEGKFFVWTPGEIRAVLGDEIGERFCRVYDVTEEGNFEEHSILNLGKTLHQWAGLLDRPEDELRQEMADARNKLLAVRRQRIAPGLDNKVLVFWNALAIDALAEAAGALDEPRYLEAAHRAADFIWQQMRRDDGRLWHVWRGGKSHGEAFLDDYAGLIQALVTLYEASFREELIVRAVSLAEVLLTHFLDKTGGGGFFFTADDHEQLIARQKPLTDESVPSGNGLAATALLRRPPPPTCWPNCVTNCCRRKASPAGTAPPPRADRRRSTRYLKGEPPSPRT
ncbi:MAG: thioredoxin domain-containing protein [Planctomycetia bacterium]|nr:thioredoxin domain-containing protein [Planctomycetia bacterium]